MLKVTNLNVHYGAIHALINVCLEVSEGEIVTLIGANGAGKSSTIRAISGMVKPSSGEISFNGNPIQHRSAHDIVKLGVSQSPEGRRVFPAMTVHENLKLGAYSRNCSKAELASDIDEMYHSFPRLKEREKQQAGTLSGGEQQMLAIARALMSRPRLLMLDEPSLGLAPFLVQTIFRIIKDINLKGMTILLVEQNANQALKLANRGYVLETGEVILNDSSSELLANDSVRKAYLGN